MDMTVRIEISEEAKHYIDRLCDAAERLEEQDMHKPIIGYAEEIAQLKAELALLQSLLPSLVAQEVQKQIKELVYLQVETGANPIAKPKLHKGEGAK